MTVKEYLHFIYDLKKVKKNRNISQKKEEYLQQIMDLVKISDVKERMIRNLSKGYRQRVGLAQALVGDPQILILDEPTVGLDPAQIIEIRELIRQLAKTRTVILSSHILSEVQAVCDRIIILHQGRIVADGSTQELAEHLSGSRQIEMEIEGNQKTIQELLRKIPSVVKVESGEKNNYTVFLADDCHDSTSIRRSIFKTLSQADCIILSMSKRSMNLEEIFLRLTAGDQAQEIEDQIGDQTSAPTETNLTENKTDPVTPKEGETQEEETDHDSNL